MKLLGQLSKCRKRLAELENEKKRIMKEMGKERIELDSLIDLLLEEKDE